MALYGLCKAGNLGTLTCRGYHRSGQYRMLWPRWGRLRRWASCHRNSWLVVQRLGELQGHACLNRKSNSSSRISQRSIPVCMILASTIFSNSLSLVSKILCAERKMAMPVSSPPWRISLERFSTPGKSDGRTEPHWRSGSRGKPLNRRMLQALFAIPFGLGDFLTVRPMMVSWTSSWLVKFGSSAGVKK